MGRMEGRWASLGRGNPSGPESIGNKLGLGSEGPLIQLCTNVKTCGHTSKKDHKLQYQAQQKNESKIRLEENIN